MESFSGASSKIAAYAASEPTRTPDRISETPNRKQGHVVAAVNTPALRQALNEIGCGPKIQCLIEKRGDLFVVEQNKTK